MKSRHYVSLPDPAPQSDPGASTVAPEVPAQPDAPTIDRKPVVAPPQVPPARRPTDISGGSVTAASSVAVPLKHPTPVTTMQLAYTQRPAMAHRPIQQQAWQRNQATMRATLERIQKEELLARERGLVSPYNPMQVRQPAYSSAMLAQMQQVQRQNPMGNYAAAGMTQQQMQQMQQRRYMQLQQLTPEQRQLYVQRMRAQQARAQQQQQQQQQQQTATMNQQQQHQMIGSQQYNQQYQQQIAHQHPQMVQTMQGAPPMPVQQPMQHGYSTQPIMARQQFPQQPGVPMNPMQRPMY